MYLNVDMLYKLCNSIYEKGNHDHMLKGSVLCSAILHDISSSLEEGNIFEYPNDQDKILLMNRDGRINYINISTPRKLHPITDEILSKYKIKKDKLKWINEYIDIKSLSLLKGNGTQCSKCKLSDCGKYREDVIITFLKPQYWDNWGHMVKVFEKDDTIKGKAVVKNNIVYCATGISAAFSVEDSILLNGVKIERCIE